MEPNNLTTRQVADLRGVSTGVIWDAVRRGELTPIPPEMGARRGYRFAPSAVAEWLPRCERARSPRYGDAELMRRLRAVATHLGRLPTAREFAQIPDVPSVGTYRRRYGSWRAACRRAVDTDRSAADDAMRAPWPCIAPDRSATS